MPNPAPAPAFVGRPQVRPAPEPPRDQARQMLELMAQARALSERFAPAPVPVPQARPAPVQPMSMRNDYPVISAQVIFSQLRTHVRIDDASLSADIRSLSADVRQRKEQEINRILRQARHDISLIMRT